MRTSSQFIVSLLASLAACGPEKDPLDDLTQGNGPNPSTPGTSDPSGSPTTNDPTTGDPTDGTTTLDPTGVPAGSGLDILFVIDNSGSMAEEQALLSKNFAALVDALGDRDVRIAVTTTDNGNPRCPNATYTPEKGQFVLSSCVDRAQQGEFTFNMNNFDYACTDYCALTDAQLQITPTETQVSDGQKAPRRWIERTAGVTNLPDGVSMTQAFQCFGPQGVAGCGFESPLAAMRQALTHAKDPGSPEYGFLRDDADLVIVFVTDEMDCGPSLEGGEIFTTNKVYWNDPADPAPTSALCWRAGVQCQGAGPTYESCAAADMDLSGSVSGPADAVLTPVGEYLEFLAQLQAAKTGGSVRLMAITGVPVGFEDGSAALVFEDAADADYQKDFGIGPGCERPDPNGGAPSRAVPPMRMLDVAQALGAPRFFSICQDDYSAALAAIAGP